MKALVKFKKNSLYNHIKKEYTYREGDMGVLEAVTVHYNGVMWASIMNLRTRELVAAKDEDFIFVVYLDENGNKINNLDYSE